MGPSGFSVRPLNSDVLHSSYMFFLLPLSFGFLSWAPHDGKYVQPEKQLPLAPRVELFFPSRLAWLRSGAGQEPAPELCQRGSKYMRARTLHLWAVSQARWEKWITEEFRWFGDFNPNGYLAGNEYPRNWPHNSYRWSCLIGCLFFTLEHKAVEYTPKTGPFGSLAKACFFLTS